MPIRPTRVTVDLGRVVHNLAVARRAAPRAQLCAVVKANGYGHGAVPVARACEAAGVDAFGVALVEEGLELRDAGIRRPILVWGSAFEGGYEAMARAQLTPVIGRLAQVPAFAAAVRAVGAATPTAVHVEIDTGMARLGLPAAELGALAAALAAAPELHLQGAMSHLSVADVAGAPFSQAQLQRFAEALTALRRHGLQPPVAHIGNSPAVLSLPGARLALVRCGLMLYGVEPMANQQTPDLLPALRWTTQVVALRRLPAGAPVSYGCRWQASRDSVVGTLAVGYADGYPRLLGNRARVLVRGERVPVVGTVCMDLCMVDLTDVPTAQVGDEAVLIGTQGPAHVDVTEVGQWADTIAYEIVCGIGARVPRTYV